jgi:hypothetical protein
MRIFPSASESSRLLAMVTRWVYGCPMSRRFLDRARTWPSWPIIASQNAQSEILISLHDILLREQWSRDYAASKNPLNQYGAKYFSSGDEDGITLEILRRLELSSGTFAELGCGGGLENNTLILLAHGWRGFWIGGEDLSFDNTINPDQLRFLKAWVTLNNLPRLIKEGMDQLDIRQVDVLSIDLDGNDYYFLRSILERGIQPKLIILEYNAKFPPPSRFVIDYDDKHIWKLDDYYGASLTSFVELLDQYTLVCCSITGGNAFFVQNTYRSKFPEVPDSITDIFIGCRYQLFKHFAHATSPKTVEQILRSQTQ